jgi:hypothetical protein
VVDHHWERGTASGQRSGTCHRCGWRGMVSTIGRRQRRRLGTSEFGRLCDECVSDLLAAKAAPELQPVPSKRRFVRNRHVA